MQGEVKKIYYYLDRINKRMYNNLLFKKLRGKNVI